MRTAALLLTLLLLGAPALAKDDPETQRAKRAIKVFHEKWRSESMSERMQALWDLGHHRHALVVDEIGKRVLADRDPEVRMAAAMILVKGGQDAKTAGRYLREALPKNEDFPDVQVQIVRAIGDLGYTEARTQLIDAAMRFLEEEYKFVTIEVMHAFGKLKDVQALPFLLKLAEYKAPTIRGRRGPEMRCSSSAPQSVRRWNWMRKYGKFAFPKGNPGEIVRWYIAALESAVKGISGQEFEDTSEFRKWLEKNAKELGIRKRDLSQRKNVLRPKPPKRRPNDE